MAAVLAIAPVAGIPPKIPEAMLELNNLKYFEIENTPLQENIPTEMIKQTAQELIAYICKQQNESNPYYFNESKMIVEFKIIYVILQIGKRK